MALSQKDLIKVGSHELGKGRSLNQIQADFQKHEVSKKDSNKALKQLEVLQYQNKEKTKAEGVKGKKSPFWIYLIIILILGGLLWFIFLK